MMTLYIRHEGGLAPRPWTSADAFPANVVWVDVEHPTTDEVATLQHVLGIDLPSKEEVWKNQALNRMYSLDGTAYMTASIINKTDTPHPQTSPITFVMTPECLVTLREINPTSFQNFAKRLCQNSRDFTGGPEILEGLLSEMITRVAHNSELVVDQLDHLSHLIFALDESRDVGQMEANRLRTLLQKLGTAADLNSKINESLLSFVRLITFFREDQADNHYVARKLEVMAEDVKELLQQTSFLYDKLNFLLDATLGMINVEQNMIMKILSVITVVIMPPTLIGSIYGMNFHFIPELSQPWGYPAALVLMVLCAVGPFLFFRWKRWL